MTTHFITAEIDLKETPFKLSQAIETELQKEGEPLRWAITEVDTDKQTAKVEAIVTKEGNREPTRTSDEGARSIVGNREQGTVNSLLPFD